MLDQPITALGPEAPDDGDPGRQKRGLAIAARVPIKKNRLGYSVPSQSGNGRYVVNLDSEPFCSCPDFELRQRPCKHIYSVWNLIQREEQPDAAEEPQPAPVQIYRQEWQAYNKAQVYEENTSPPSFGDCATPWRRRPLLLPAARGCPSPIFSSVWRPRSTPLCPPGGRCPPFGTRSPRPPRQGPVFRHHLQVYGGP